MDATTDSTLGSFWGFTKSQRKNLIKMNYRLGGWSKFRTNNNGKFKAHIFRASKSFFFKLHRH